MSITRASFVGFVLTLAGAAAAQPGFIDPSFGGGDFFVHWTPTGSGGGIRRVLVQGDGKIVAVGLTGTFNEFGAMRLNTNGTFDTSFGQGGVAIPNTSHGYTLGHWAWDGAIQSDGKIVMVDNVLNVVRLGTTGSLDSGFGTGGIGSIRAKNGSNYAGSRAIALRSDGKLVLAGDAGKILLARMNANGTADTTFGTSQSPGVLSDSDSVGYGPMTKPVLVAASDGRITMAGSGGADCVIVRYLATGAPDTSFGTNGKVHFGFLSVACGLVVTGDGHLIVAGQTPHNINGFFAARFTPAGLDTTFGVGGMVSFMFPQPAPAAICGGLALQADGGVVIAGAFPEAGGTGFTDIGVWRLTSAGLPDTTFGPTGDGVSQLAGVPGSNDSPSSIVVDGTGRIIIAGSGSGGPEFVAIHGQ